VVNATSPLSRTVRKCLWAAASLVFLLASGAIDRLDSSLELTECVRGTNPEPTVLASQTQLTALSVTYASRRVNSGSSFHLLARENCENGRRLGPHGRAFQADDAGFDPSRRLSAKLLVTVAPGFVEHDEIAATIPIQRPFELHRRHWSD
jgi:hypothetical protein